MRIRILPGGLAVALLVLSGCATPPAKPAAAQAVAATSTGDASAAGEKGRPLAPAAAKAFAAAVQKGDEDLQAQDFDRAIYDYIQALEKSPNDATTLAKIGAIEDARGEAALAEKAFDLAHAADPKDPRIAERLARLYLREARIDNAAELYLAVLSQEPDRAPALEGMGEVCVARDAFEDAVRYFDRALAATKADRAAVLTHRGYAKARLNDLDGAEADFRAALNLQSREDAWRYLGDLLARRGDSADALEALVHVMDTSQAYNEIGIMLMGVGKFQAAKDYFSKAIKAAPSYFEEAQKNLAVADEHLRTPSG